MKKMAEITNLSSHMSPRALAPDEAWLRIDLEQTECQSLPECSQQVMRIKAIGFALDVRVHCITTQSEV